MAGNDDSASRFLISCHRPEMARWHLRERGQARARPLRMRTYPAYAEVIGISFGRAFSTFGSRTVRIPLACTAEI